MLLYFACSGHTSKMTRLPISGSDEGTWGDILNAFLLVEHNPDGTLRASGTMATKADDSATVHLAGPETITGAKSFNDATVLLNGLTSGATTLKATAIAGATTVTLPAATDTLVGKATTDTLTNKRISPRVATTASSATPTPNADTDDLFLVTALAASATFSSPSGTPVEGQSLLMRIKDNGSAQSLAWNAIYRPVGAALPTTTAISKTLYVGFKYNNIDTKWDCLAVAQES